MWIEPAISASIIGAVAGLAIAVVGLLPLIGRLHRLERVVTILEKVEDPHAREPLIAVRDRLIEGLRPRSRPAGFFFVLSIAFQLAAVASMWSGVWLRTNSVDTSTLSELLIVAGMVLLMVGIATLIVALVDARRGRHSWDSTQAVLDALK